MPFDMNMVEALPYDEPLIIDNFAGGGGASTGIEWALGRSPDVAINHDAEALGMHAANHPDTVHLSENIWHVDPLDVVKRRKVGLAWFSPDCTHFSKAKGGKPKKKNIRDLAWVVVMWIKRARPDVIFLENVEEFLSWCELDESGQPITGQAGSTFDKWLNEIRREGYEVDWKILKACDYGAPTIRKRLFLIARCDGQPIRWPTPTHASPSDIKKGGKWDFIKPYRTAADIIDWSIPCPSIFDTAEQIKEKLGLRAVRPLAENTMARIAKGVKKFLIDCEEPFFVTYGQHGGGNRSGFEPHHTITASAKDQNCIVTPHLSAVGGRSAQIPPRSVEKPLNTLTTKPDSVLVAPNLVSVSHGDSGGRREYDIEEPLGTITAKNNKALVAAFLAQHNTGVVGHDVRKPLSTITGQGSQQNVVHAHMMSLKGSDRRGSDARQPLSTLTAQGGHASTVVAFLQKYYGTGVSVSVNDPAPTVTTKDRYGLVTVNIQGQDYAIVDIGMRMLTARERFLAQGFGPDYIIDRTGDGKKLTVTAQGRMCGNSVCPQLAEALVRANCSHLARERIAA